MGGIISYFGFGAQGRTDDPDPVTGLTSRDRYHIKKTWGVVRQNPTESGVAVFQVFFKNYPKYKQAFPFRDVPDDELPSNKRFQAHVNSVIYGVSAIVDAIDDPSMLATILERIGESHVPRGIQAGSFNDLKVSLVELFTSLFTEEEVESWKKVLDVATDLIIKAFNERSSK